MKGRAAGTSEHLEKLAYHSTAANEGTSPENHVVDTDANRAVMQIDHFTDFALVSEAGLRLLLPLVLKSS